MKTESHNIKSTYTTDSMRKVRDEDGTVRVARMVEERQVAVDIQRTEDGRFFFRGAVL